MEQGFLLVIAAFTSFGVYGAGVIAFGRTHRGLRAALLRTIELIGLSVVFFAANLIVGLAVVLTIRTLTTGFVSAYFLNDIFLVALSLLQGLLFGCWRD